MATKRQRDVVGALSHVAIAGLFASAAYVQLNDPDPGLWIFTYAFSSACALYTAAVAYGALPFIALEYAFPIITVVSFIPGSMLFRSVCEDWSFYTALKNLLTGSINCKQLVEVETVREVGGMALVLAYQFLVAYPLVLEQAYSTVSGASAAGKLPQIDPLRKNAPTSARGDKDGETDGTSDASSVSALTSPKTGADVEAVKPVSPSSLGPVYGRAALLFLGLYSALWAGWTVTLRAGGVEVGEHCSGML